MNVINVRVDDRLVHGVVATNWVPRLRIERVVVIDQESARDPMMKSALRMATPKSVFLSTIELDKFLKNNEENTYENQKIMIVVKSLKPIIDLIDAGFQIPEVTLGNLGRQGDSGDAEAVTRFIAVNEEIRAQIEYLHEKKVKLTAQLIPENDPVDFYKVMKKKEGEK